ncbi:fibrinogen-like protein 1 [Lampetra planeri]
MTGLRSMSLLLVLIAVSRGQHLHTEGGEWEPGPCDDSEVRRLRGQVTALERALGEAHARAHALLQERAARTAPPPQPPPRSASAFGSQGEYADCAEAFNAGRVRSGYYRVRPRSAPDAFTAYCDMSDGGGWTVLQRRTDGAVDFNRAWKEYKDGFGNFKTDNSEYWLGNEKIHQLTIQGDYILKVDLTDWDGDQRDAQYQRFQVADEKAKYQLTFGAYSGGTAGDALSGGFHPETRWWADLNGMSFSTRDRDSDRYEEGQCAREDTAGWWFNRCHGANLNGVYHLGGPYSAGTDNGIVWYTWRGWWYSYRAARMKVRPAAFQPAEAT